MFSVQNVKTFGYKLVTKVSSLYFMPGDGKKARQKCGETSPKTACPLWLSGRIGLGGHCMSLAVLPSMISILQVWHFFFAQEKGGRQFSTLLNRFSTGFPRVFPLFHRESLVSVDFPRTGQLSFSSYCILGFEAGFFERFSTTSPHSFPPLKGKTLWKAGPIWGAAHRPKTPFSTGTQRTHSVFRGPPVRTRLRRAHSASRAYSARATAANGNDCILRSTGESPTEADGTPYCPIHRGRSAKADGKVYKATSSFPAA